MCFNNLSNSSIERFSNKVYYRFKIKKVIQIAIAIDKNLDKKAKKQLNYLETTWFRYCQKVVDAILYVSLLSKIRYDSMYVSLLLESSEKIFLRLYWSYTLLDRHNNKLNNQRIDLFLIKRRINRLIYKLDLLSR